MPRGSAPGERRGGRKKGSRNKRTEERLAAMQAAAKQIEDVISGAFAGDAHALLVAIYKDPAHSVVLRLEAAKAAIAYEKPKLAAVQYSGSLKSGQWDPDDLSDAELTALIREGLKEHGELN